MKFKGLIALMVFVVAGVVSCSVEDLTSLIPDDKFESNDTFANAYDITLYPNSSGTGNIWISDIDTGKSGVVGGDLGLVTSLDTEDFYMIDVTGLSGTVSFAFLYAGAAVGDTVEVEIYDESEALLKSMSIDGATTTSGDVTRYDYDYTLAGTETTIYLKVILTPAGSTETQAAYTLAWDTTSLSAVVPSNLPQ